jgi:hypothetical protein
MSVTVGPSISTNGLIFHYDISNTQKSWAGAPTTNVVVNKIPTTGWGVNNYLTSSATTTFETENGIPHLKITNVITDTGYPRLQDSNLTSTVTDGCSASFEAKGTPGAQIHLAIYSSGSTKIQNLATLTSDWQRFTFNNIVTGFVLDQPYLRPLTNTATYYVRNIQIEQNTVSTPFTNSSRTNTQAVLDLTGRNTITATSLTYAIDGSFSFNGSSNYISTNLIPNQTQGAVNVWIKMDSLKDYNTIFDNALGANDWEFWVYATGVARFRTTADNSDIIVDSPALSAGIWYNLTVCWSSTFAKLYTNGVLSSTDSVTGTRTTPSTLSIAGGNAGNTKFAGLIPYFQVYNRTLSDAEVLSNFNAARSRFGL